MTKQCTVRIRVPASTANLGPAFDCLGLALDIWNEVNLSLEGQGFTAQIEGEGAGELPIDRENLIFHVVERFYSYCGEPFPQAMTLHCLNGIPISSGLGSSAAAVVASLLAARELLNFPVSDNELIALAAEFEGHADNAAACLLGGLVVVIKTEQGWIAEKLPVRPLSAIIALPDLHLSTSQARSVLPEQVSLGDAVANISRTAMLLESLRANRSDLMRHAMQDSLHQPYRLKLMPGAEEAMQAAYSAGAKGAAISGAGPSLIAFANENLDAIGAAMQAAFSQAGVACRLLTTRSSRRGAEVIR